MQLSQANAEKRIAELMMDDLPLEPIHPTPTQVAPDWFKKYHELVRAFTTTLTDSVSLHHLHTPFQPLPNLPIISRSG